MHLLRDDFEVAVGEVYLIAKATHSATTLADLRQSVPLRIALPLIIILVRIEVSSENRWLSIGNFTIFVDHLFSNIGLKAVGVSMLMRIVDVEDPKSESRLGLHTGPAVHSK